MVVTILLSKYTILYGKIMSLVVREIIQSVARRWTANIPNYLKSESLGTRLSYIYGSCLPVQFCSIKVSTGHLHVADWRNPRRLSTTQSSPIFSQVHSCIYLCVKRLYTHAIPARGRSNAVIEPRPKDDLVRVI